MQVFEYSAYKPFLRAACDARKVADRSFSYARLAAAIKVQRSYLSHVLNGDAHLSVDQLFDAGRHLRLDEDETDYLVLLLELERCQSGARRRHLMSRRDAAQAARLETGAYLGHDTVQTSDAGLAAYYGDPYCSLVHMFLTVPAYLRETARIAERLQLGKARLQAILGVLEQCRIVQLTKGGAYELLRTTMHLPEPSHLARVHGTAMRLYGIEARQRGASAGDHFFTATFSATEAVRTAIHAAFLTYLKGVTRKVDTAPAEEVFHMSFDLFRV